MNQHSSSTSSSDASENSERDGTARGLRLLAWTALFLIAIDFVVGKAFAYPDDPQNLSPNPVALYFDYGRSMEGRLRRATRADPDRSAPITLAGWYDPLIDVERPASDGATSVTIYGMSHAVRLADALDETEPGYRVRSVGAPGASTNWSYGAFLRDEKRTASDVAVLAIMSSTLPMILSPTPMDWNTSFAMPYTADRFYADESGLKRVQPPYESFAGYVETLNDPQDWQAALEQFSETDPFFDPFLVRQTWLDQSVIVRLVRRAWSQRRDHRWREGVLTARGYSPDSEAVRVANAIVADFAEQARSQGILPVIYVVDSHGYGDQLTRALSRTLEQKDIAFVSTSQLLDPMDPTNYLPDSHFTDDNDRLLARSLARTIENRIERPR